MSFDPHEILNRLRNQSNRQNPPTRLFEDTNKFIVQQPPINRYQQSPDFDNMSNQNFQTDPSLNEVNYSKSQIQQYSPKFENTANFNINQNKSPKRFQQQPNYQQQNAQQNQMYAQNYGFNNELVQQNNSVGVIERNVVDELMNKINLLEKHISNIENDLKQARQDVIILKGQKQDLEQHVIDLEREKQQNLIQLEQSYSQQNTLKHKNSQDQKQFVQQQFVNANSQSPKDQNIIKMQQLNENSINSNDNNHVLEEVAEVIERESVEKILSKKEKNFIPYAQKNSFRYNQPKAAGYLHLDQLAQVMSEYPNISKPIIRIGITEKDLE